MFGKRRASVHEGTGGNQLLNIADVKPLIGGISNLCAFTKYGFGEARGTVQSRVGQELSERFRHIVIACVKKRLTEAVHIDRDQKVRGNILDLPNLRVKLRVFGRGGFRNLQRNRFDLRSRRSSRGRFFNDVVAAGNRQV